MERVVATSEGLISVNLNPDQRLGPARMGFSATIVVFGADGWEVKGKTWNRKYADSALGEFLASFVGLPREEAEALATDIQGAWIDEWRARGGEADDRDLRRFANRFLVAVALVVAFALAGIILSIWFLST